MSLWMAGMNWRDCVTWAEAVDMKTCSTEASRDAKTNGSSLQTYCQPFADLCREPKHECLASRSE